MGIKNIAQRFEELGQKAEVIDGRIELAIDGKEISLDLSDDWLESIDKFYKARQYRFSIDQKALFSNTKAEYLIVRLDPGYYYRVEHEFQDERGNKVTVSPASKEFLLSYFHSDKYSESFHRIISRIHRRVRIRTRGRGRRVTLRVEDFFFNFHTATYKADRKPRNKKIEDVAFERVRACLFALSYRKDESWELSQEIKSGRFFYSAVSEDENRSLTIPSANYDKATTTYYKIAKSSQFPSQVFLSYYHILEFHFLRVADENLYNAVCSQLNDPAFNASYANVNRLLATVKRNDTTVDEKQMLLGVLRKYVAEEELIALMKDVEENVGEKLYSLPKQKIFGEIFSIKLESGHALSNVSGVLKHIRNALVHSSDRYSREDCFLPMSESENVVVKYIPLIQYLAEQVIFSTAKS